MKKSQTSCLVLGAALLGYQGVGCQAASGENLVEGRAVWASPGSVAFWFASVAAIILLAALVVALRRRRKTP